MVLNHFLDGCGEEVSRSLLDEDDHWVKELHFELEQCSEHLIEEEEINVLK